MSTPHDTLFHSTFGRARHARGLLQSRLPTDAAVVVDWVSLRPAPERIDSLDLRLHTADVVHCAELLVDLSIYFLLEHSSVLVRALRQKLLRYGRRVSKTLARREGFRKRRAPDNQRPWPILASEVRLRPWPRRCTSGVRGICWCVSWSTTVPSRGANSMVRMRVGGDCLPRPERPWWRCRPGSTSC